MKLQENLLTLYLFLLLQPSSFGGREQEIFGPIY